MPRTYTTRSGDMLDLICYREYGGRQSGAVEAVTDANYGLADLPPRLPPGVTITLPDLPAERAVKNTQKLWD